MAVLAFALLVASCSSGSDSSGKKSPTSSTGKGTAQTPTAFVPTGAEAAVAKYLESLGDVYVGDCTNAKLPRDRGKWCSTLVEDGADKKVYKVGPVGEDAKLLVTVSRHGNATLTPGFQVDVGDGDVGTPRPLTLEELLANAFITGNIILDQQAGIGNGLSDLPGTPGAPATTPDQGTGSSSSTSSSGGGGSVTITVIPPGGQGTNEYPPPPPSITVDDPNVHVGGDVVIRGHNCGANESLDVLFDGKHIGTIQSDAKGDFVTAVNIPIGTTPGPHTVTVRGSVCELSVTINVLGGLAFTGAGNDTGTTVLVGISLLALGVVLVVGSRRRRSSGSVRHRSRVT